MATLSGAWPWLVHGLAYSRRITPNLIIQLYRRRPQTYFRHDYAPTVQLNSTIRFNGLGVPQAAPRPKHDSPHTPQPPPTHSPHTPHAPTPHKLPTHPLRTGTMNRGNFEAGAPHLGNHRNWEESKGTGISSNVEAG